MPELPEVEVLARHLAPLLKGRTIRGVQVCRAKVLRPTAESELKRALKGSRVVSLTRRGKYLVFTLRRPRQRSTFLLLGHLGMTGRMYLLPARAPLPKHTAAALRFGRQRFVVEDTRYFGRLTLDTSPLRRLGPEPLEKGFSVAYLADVLRRSSQSIKMRFLDQSVVAGLGNIYASEVLFRARISPRLPANRLTARQRQRLHQAIRGVLSEAIAWGSTVPLNWSGNKRRDGFFYYGRAADAPDYYEERLRVYGRAGRPCPRCRTPIQRIVQAARSTFFCPRCQAG